ncbi:FAD-dependent oxidoreductase [Propionicicella superfundia]|uniref:FAD-dependent oxidoreductase n=1 Tax=Propionicicella superfundia TaxID=348582 RepID=UPI00048C89E8|nr:FAD-dependent oxidoreductase [Propionicicella superfundia]
MDEPRRVAIVGAGPAGLFTAAALLTGTDDDLCVDIFDRLPTPFGLLRYGVAPDHAGIKAVATTLARVFDAPRVRFLGLVDLGGNVTVPELRGGYDAVVYAIGAEDDRHLGIPGEDLPGSRSARQFVAWYSGHPDATPQPLADVRRAVVVGVGNVAVDVARILLKDPAELSATDMPDAVLAELRTARIEDVWLVGRRGPEHASFTTPELRELLHTAGDGVSVTGCDLGAIDTDALDRRARANVAAIADAADIRSLTASRRLHLVFWHRPVEILGDRHVEAVRLEPADGPGAGAADGPPDAVIPETRPPASGELTVPADLVLRSIGYRGVPLPGVPFDDGRIPNLEGRVLELDGSARPGEYAVGWIKRGPVGLIGSNRKDAAETAGHVLEDLATLPRRPLSDFVATLAGRGVRPSTLEDWRRIDAAEIARGSIRGRERTKVEAWHDLLALVSRA